MILARVFSNIYKEGGIILVDSKGQKYICGNPRRDNPITVKLLKENLNWKIILNPETIVCPLVSAPLLPALPLICWNII